MISEKSDITSIQLRLLMLIPTEIKFWADMQPPGTSTRDDGHISYRLKSGILLR